MIRQQIMFLFSWICAKRTGVTDSYFLYWKNEAMANLKKAKAMYIQKQQELEKVCN